MPGPGTYAIPTLIGKDSTSKTLGASIKYNPELVENAKKPGPGAYDGNVLVTRRKEP